jgi:hypothetical protein
MPPFWMKKSTMRLTQLPTIQLFNQQAKALKTPERFGNIDFLTYRIEKSTDPYNLLHPKTPIEFTAQSVRANKFGIRKSLLLKLRPLITSLSAASLEVYSQANKIPDPLELRIYQGDNRIPIVSVLIGRGKLLRSNIPGVYRYKRRLAVTSINQQLTKTEIKSVLRNVGPDIIRLLRLRAQLKRENEVPKNVPHLLVGHLPKDLTRSFKDLGKYVLIKPNKKNRLTLKANARKVPFSKRGTGGFSLMRMIYLPSTPTKPVPKLLPGKPKPNLRDSGGTGGRLG